MASSGLCRPVGYISAGEKRCGLSGARRRQIPSCESRLGIAVGAIGLFRGVDNRARLSSARLIFVRHTQPRITLVRGAWHWNLLSAISLFDSTQNIARAVE